MTHDPLLLEQISKLLLAALLSGVIGIERLVTHKPAGMRTCMLIGVGSCLFTILSIDSFGGEFGGDPSRLAGQVVVGVGFLGAGTLLQNQNRVYGLTTAATIWLVAGVGVTIGAGQLLLGLAVTAIVLGALWGCAPLSDWIKKHWRRPERGGDSE